MRCPAEMLTGESVAEPLRGVKALAVRAGWPGVAHSPLRVWFTLPEAVFKEREGIVQSTTSGPDTVEGRPEEALYTSDPDTKQQCDARCRTRTNRISVTVAVR